MRRNINPSIISLVLSICVGTYLAVAFTNPSGSLALLIALLICAVISPIAAIVGVRKKKSDGTILIVILSFVTSCPMILLFFLMWIMGA